MNLLLILGLFTVALADGRVTADEVRVQIDWQAHPAMHIPWKMFRRGLTDRALPRRTWKHVFRQTVTAQTLEDSGVRIFLAAAMAAERARNPGQARRLILKQFAYVEAFNLSAGDVSLHRLVAFGLGPLVKAAFDEIFRSPFISRVMVTELDPANPLETFYTVDADGAFTSSANAAVVSDTADNAEVILQRLRGGDDRDGSLAAALVRALDAWAEGRAHAGREQVEEVEEAGEPVTEQERGTAVRAALDAGRIEVAVLDRTLPTKTKFRLLTEADLEGALAAFR